MPVWRGLLDRLAVHHPGRQPLDGTMLLGLDGPFTVDGLAQGVHDTPNQRLADRNLRNATGSLDQVPLFNEDVFSQENHPHVILFQIEDHADDVVG